MNWLDVVVLVILVSVAGLETVRGFGRALMDALWLYGALWLANACAPALSHTVHFQNNPSANACWAYVLLLAAFGGVGLVLANFLYQMTLIDAGMFDHLLGMLSGIAVAMMIAHGFVRIVAMSLPNTSDSTLLISSSFLGSEMLSFNTYHSLINTLTGAAPLHRDLPS